MTAVGKILVFLNLVFSLVVAAFVVMVFVARTHWEEENKSLKGQNSVLTASAATYRAEVVKAQQDAEAKVGKKDAELKNAQKDLADTTKDLAQVRDDLSKLKIKHEQQVALASKSGTEVNKRQEDVAKLRETLGNERKTNNDLAAKNAELSRQATVAQIERRSVQDMNGRLEAQLQQMAKDMARLRASGGTATVRAGVKNPPPDSVEGLVKNTDASGLMTITIGSDAGLARGHTLELFRLNAASPSQSKYLGTVRILEADAHQAVVQPVGRLAGPPQPGDRVASRIVGG